MFNPVYEIIVTVNPVLFAKSMLEGAIYTIRGLGNDLDF